MTPLLRRSLAALLLGGLCAAAPIHAQPGPWRIQHITYTRRQHCDVPPDVQK